MQHVVHIHAFIVVPYASFILSPILLNATTCEVQRDYGTDHALWCLLVTKAAHRRTSGVGL